MAEQQDNKTVPPGLPQDGEWGIVQLMGHVRWAGWVSECQRFGATVGRVDIPDGDTWVTQFFGGSALYEYTPCDETIARAVASREVRPVEAYKWTVKEYLLSLPEAKQNDEQEEDLGPTEGIVRESEMREQDDDDFDDDDSEDDFEEESDG